jgi:UDP-N-acetylglucosamine:LPS N-acetylglucosamine transferase
MKVLFTAQPDDGHLLPLMPLADAFRAQGHTVLFATGPEGHRLVEGSGHHVRSAGLSRAQRLNLAAHLRAPGLQPRDLATFALGTLFTRLCAPQMTADLLSLSQEYPADLLIHESAEFAAPLVSALTGEPAVHHSYGVLRPEPLQAMATEAMASVWDSFGLPMPPHAGMFSHGYLDVCPPSLQAAHIDRYRDVRLAIRSVSRSAKYTESPPLVLITVGTVFHRTPGLIESLLAACGSLPAQVLCTTGPGTDPLALAVPANATVVEYVPLAQMLPRCSVVVSHGGSGTMLGALAHGIPLVLLPQGADQFINAEAVSAAGAGLLVNAPTEVTAAVLTALTDPAVRSVAEDLAREIAALPDPSQVAHDLAAR